MPLFRKLTDEEFVEKILQDQRKILERNYDLLEEQTDYPKNANLVNPDKIFATSYENLGNDKIRIHIGYKRTWSGWVTDTMRMNYNQIIKGSLLCENIFEVEEMPYEEKSKIEMSFFSKIKQITFPVQTGKSISIKCKKLFIEDIDIYVKQDNKLILDREFRELIGRNPILKK
jgi:hypothetical protein